MHPQKMRKLRGKAAEEMVKARLPDIGCMLERSYEGGEKTARKMQPDLDVVCDGKATNIEVKEATMLESAGHSVAGHQQFRLGRFQLSPDGVSKMVRKKGCYALVVDDPISNSITIDFVKPDIIDDEFRRLAKTGQSPKFPTYRVLELRQDRCFPDIGTMVADRGELEMYMDKEWNLSYKRELAQRKEKDG